MKKYLKNTISVVFTAMLGMGFSACSDVSTQSKTEKTQAVDDGLPKNAPTYLVAMSAGYPPYAFRDEHGYVVGYDTDILKAIGKAEGFRIKILNRQWDGIFTTLDDDSRDMVASGAVFREDRAEKMEVSAPISSNADTLFVPENSEINSLNDLAGKVISAQGNTVMHDNLQKLVEGKPIKTQGFKSMYLAFKAVMTGEVAGVYGNSAVINYFINNLSKEQAASAPVDLKKISIANTEQKKNLTVVYLKKGNTKLLNKIDRGLKQIKANGEYQKINQKWFGKNDTL